MPEPSPSPARQGSAGVGAAVSETPASTGLIAEAEPELYGDAVVEEPGGAGAPGPALGRRRKKNVVFSLAIGWLVVAALVALLANALPFVDALDTYDASAQNQGPSGGHWFGVDGNGRDVFSRAAYAMRISLIVGFLAVLVGGTVGGLLGLLAGYYRGRLESFLVSVTDVMLAFPALVLALAIISFAGQSLRTVTIALAILSVPALFRVTRANTLVFAQREFVTAARTLGARNRRIIFREVLPNVVPPMLSYALIVVAVLIVAEGALSFLGLGVPTPTATSAPTFGGMINDGRQNLEEAPHIALMPSLMLFLTILSLNLVGDRLRSRFDIRESGL